MTVEHRCLATLDEVLSVEVECTKEGCSGMIRLDLKIGCLDPVQACPRCRTVWWPEHGTKSSAYKLLSALLHYRSEPISTDPAVKLVFDGKRLIS